MQRRNRLHLSGRRKRGFFFLAEARRMACDVITLGEVAERGAEMIEIRCGRPVPRTRSLAATA